jgi:hypothetical protein
MRFPDANRLSTSLENAVEGPSTALVPRSPLSRLSIKDVAGKDVAGKDLAGKDLAGMTSTSDRF